MESINAVTSGSYYSQVQYASAGSTLQQEQTAFIQNEPNLQQAVLSSDLFSRISSETSSDLSQIFQGLETLTIQSLEVGQTTEGRFSLQQEAESGLSDLRSVLENLPGEELALFTAEFANQIPDSLLNTGDSASDSSEFLEEIGLSNTLFESLFFIDISSAEGSLIALELLELLLEILGGQNDGAGLLGGFLQDQDNSIFNLQVLEISASGDQSTNSDSSQDSGTSDAQVTEPASSTVPAEETIPAQTSLNENPPTIIELAG